MKPLPYQAIIVDFDRTLLRTDKTVSEQTVNVLRAWQEAGARLFAATARPERAITTYCELIPFDAVTTLNGARTIVGETVFENPIPRASAESVLAQLGCAEGMVISVETEQGIYANEDIPLWAPVVTDRIQQLPETHRIFKILASHPEIPVDRIAVNLPEDTYQTVADRKLLQYMGREATKWNGVRKMLEVFSIPAGQAVYFGDDNDDMEPIQRCGRGVAVRNAIAPVLEAADEVTGSNDEDGVAVFLLGLLKNA